MFLRYEFNFLIGIRANLTASDVESSIFIQQRHFCLHVFFLRLHLEALNFVNWVKRNIQRIPWYNTYLHTTIILIFYLSQVYQIKIWQFLGIKKATLYVRCVQLSKFARTECNAMGHAFVCIRRPIWFWEHFKSLWNVMNQKETIRISESKSVSMKYGVTFFNCYLAEFVYHWAKNK